MFTFDNSYARLPETYHQAVTPTTITQPQLIIYNQPLADTLGVETTPSDNDTLAHIFSGQRLLPGSQPIAMAYAGHQFGHFVPQLGDGRALLLGEVIGHDKRRYDIQLKGAGPTPFSRNGDGRSAMGPVIREYLLSEAMHALGIPTTRALAAVSSGDLVFREEALPGAILTRVASSHIRVGTFEYFASRKDWPALKVLADYCIQRHYPELINSDNPYLDFLEAVGKRQISLVTQWMGMGFIHGVMNTDNTSICGETIDFGPCAFMDHFAFNRVFSSIDRQGRYAYDQQGQMAFWNLSSLANCLTPLIQDDTEKATQQVKDVMARLPDFFNQQSSLVMGKKLGLSEATPNDLPLVSLWLRYLQDENLDFSRSFRALSRLLDTPDRTTDLPKTEGFTQFYTPWQQRLTQQAQNSADTLALMNRHNPCYIPRNHLVEKAIALAINGDYSLFYRLNKLWASPFTEQADSTEFTHAPTTEETVTQTFCGT